MSGYTPGPWKWSHGNTRLWGQSLRDSENTLVRQVLQLDERGPTESNARLIAAAPELLEVAEALLKHGSINPPHWIWEKAEEAVEKAGRL